MNDRPTPLTAEGTTALRPEQCRHDLAVVTDVPAWHAPDRGSVELGEYNSRPFGVPATAAGALVVDDDGAHSPSVLGSLWGYRGEGEPYITLDLGGIVSGGVGVKLRLAEAQQLVDDLQALVAAGRAGGAL